MILPKIQNVSRDKQFTVKVTRFSQILGLIFEIILMNEFVRISHPRSEKEYGKRVIQSSYLHATFCMYLAATISYFIVEKESSN